MKILVLGGDGRAHAICSRLVEEGHEVCALPGSAGTQAAGATSLGEDLAKSGLTEVEFIKSRARYLDLAIVCHVEASRSGMVDELRAVGRMDGMAVFGPGRVGAALETGKIFGRNRGAENGLPLPESLWIGMLGDVLDGGEWPDTGVLKIDGLAGGRGVAVFESSGELKAVARHWLARRCVSWDTAVIIEERIIGVEVSFGVLCDGVGARGLCTTFEHKRAHNGDMGTLTAEMGTVVLPGVAQRPMDELIQPMMPFLQAVDYRGFLDVNTIVQDDGSFRVLEWTCRPGDPEIEIALTLVKEDVGDLFYRTAKSLPYFELQLHEDRAAVGVVIAGGGYPYPDAVLQGLPIGFGKIDCPTPGHRLYFMGVEKRDGALVTRGGRHLLVVATGGSVGEAARNATEAAKNYRILDGWYRTDIGAKWGGDRAFLWRHGVITEMQAQL